MTCRFSDAQSVCMALLCMAKQKLSNPILKHDTSIVEFDFKLSTMRVDKSIDGGHFIGVNVTGSALIEGGGISLRIVDLLDKYQSALPIEFLAMQLGCRPESLMADLSSLEARGVVKL